MKYLDIEIEKLAAPSFYTEGPAMDPSGNLFFTTLSGAEIWKVDRTGVLSVWSTSCGCPNGQIILKGGDHVVCDSGRGAVSLFSAQGLFSNDFAAGQCAGSAFTTPNDLVSDEAGNIYFTDSVRHTGKVYLLGADGSQHVVAEGLDYPNGLALSADQKKLYVAESFQNRILALDLSPGRQWEATVLATLPCHGSGKKEDNLPDGLTVDCNGNVWVAHYGMGALQVVSRKGKWLCSIETGLPLTSNVIFIDAHSLMVTGGYGEPGPGAVLKIKL